MITNIEPSYKLTEGVVFVVGDHQNISEGDKVDVYIPTLMTNIRKDLTKEVRIQTIHSPNQIFLNSSKTMPLSSNIVTVKNCIGIKVSSGLILERANKDLMNNENSDIPSKPIQYIPDSINLKSGDELNLSTNLGSLLDARLDKEKR